MIRPLQDRARRDERRAEQASECLSAGLLKTREHPLPLQQSMPSDTVGTRTIAVASRLGGIARVRPVRQVGVDELALPLRTLGELGTHFEIFELHMPVVRQVLADGKGRSIGLCY
jgi:hypothetical protein